MLDGLLSPSAKIIKNLITSSLLLQSSLKITLLFPLTPAIIYMSPTVITWKPIMQAYSLGNSLPLRPILFIAPTEG